MGDPKTLAATLRGRADLEDMEWGCKPSCDDYRRQAGDVLEQQAVRAEKAEAALIQAEQALRALDQWCNERREAPTITTLGMVQERVRTALRAIAGEK